MNPLYKLNSAITDKRFKYKVNSLMQKLDN